MTREIVNVRLVLASALAAGLAAGTVAPAHAYPVNECVGRKQVTAGTYCKRALGAWARWETDQRAERRDAALGRAAVTIFEAWDRADRRALAQGTDCAETTLSPAAARNTMSAAVAAIVAEVNGGLDLGNPAEASCGRRLLKAAAIKCARVLKAEGRFVANLGEDPQATRRDALRALASGTFGRTWAKVVAGGCPTSAAERDVEARIDALVADVVRDTTVSPDVDDAQFTTISPTGSTAYLGREFTPVCMNGSPYHYFVKRGSVNKLLVYYQGGGACWEQLTCSVPVCDASVDPGGSDNPNNPGGGFSDRNNPANPFRDWNVVFVPYCSCDVHFGDAAQDYPLHVEHRGYQNARVVEKWAREHFVNPEVVFVTGSSAGAYGAWFHAPLLHQVWPASEFNVLADAGNGVITQDFLVNEFPNWNFAANLPPDIPGLADVLASGTGIPGYTEVVADFFPATRWAHYTTAFDGGTGGQTGFYNVMLNNNDPIQALFWWNASCAFNQVMRAQAIATAAAVPDNYRYYIGTGSRHTMWGSNKVYTDTTGGVPTIVDWVNAMLAGGPAWTNVECTNCGLTLPGDPKPSPLQPPFSQVGADVIITCP
jgi:hypothetical protein